MYAFIHQNSAHKVSGYRMQNTDILGEKTVINFFQNGYIEIEEVERVERSEKRTTYGKSLIVLGSLFLAYVISFLMILLLAYILLKVQPSEKVIQGAVIVIYILSTFIGGFFIGKKMEKKQYLWGMVLGILYFLIVFLISFTLHKDITGQTGSLITVLIMCTLGGTLGGMIS